MQLRRRSALWLVPAGLLTAQSSLAVPDIYDGEPARTVAECDEKVRRHPGVTAWFCYNRYFIFHRGDPELHRRIESLVERQPRNPYPLLVLANFRDYLGDPRALRTYAQAEEGFRKTGDVEGETVAAVWALARGAWDADPEVGWPLYEHALQVARSTGDPDALVWVYTYGGELAVGVADYGRAHRILEEARALIRPGTPWWLHQRLWDCMGRALSALGRHAEALESFDRAVSHAADHYFFRGYSSHGAAEEAVRLYSAGQMDRAEVDRRIDRALALERADHLLMFNFRGAALTELLQAVLRGPSSESAAAVERALRIGAPTHQEILLWAGWRLRARFTVESGGPWSIAHADAERVVNEAREAADLADMALGQLAAAHVDWKTGHAPEFRADAAATLASVERIRRGQAELVTRARVSSDWAFAYELLAGWSLDLAAPEPDRAALEESLAIMERWRGRVLLDGLLRAGLSPPPVPPELERRRATALQSLTRAQRALVVPGTAAGARAEAGQRLQDVERELETVEDLVARVSPGSEPLPVPTLAELQNELRSDEALLSFQLWPRDLSLQAPFPEGRSWLLVLTRHSAFAVRVPDAHRLAPEVSMFLAVLGGRAGSARVPGQSLHRELLRDALDRLPPDVRQLIVIPDGPLHALPLETLRSEDGRALAERYSVAVVPSATLWYRWVHGAPTGPTGALALADPSPPGEAGIHRDAARWLEGLRLPSLPQARAESEAMVAALGEGGMLRTGDEASEHFLKRSDLARWGVVHLATHAVVDETQPDRSAVVLAPGSEEEDGLLQPREIGKLDLRGKIVVLSGCRTAGGPVFRGEGPLGLVHAFFQAGARAVIASPWPLDDRGARELVGELAGRLRQGQTLAASLAGAKRTLIREGVAESVWAGLQLYGDGRITLASPVAQRSLPVVAMSAGLLGAVLLALLASRQSRASGAEVDQRDERAGRP